MQKDDMYYPLAEYIAAAVLAYRMGISPQRALTHYVRKNEMDESWLDLAKAVSKATAMGSNVSALVRKR